MQRARFGLMILSAVLVLQLAPGRVATQALQPQSGPETFTIAATTPSELRLWDEQVTSMLRSGVLRMMPQREDTVMPSREHERLAQLHDGIPVFGAEVTRQLDRGVAVSMFGTLYRDIDIDTIPQLSVPAARAIMLARPNAVATIGDPQLFVLPLEGGGYALTYRIVTAFPDDHVVAFVDAENGRIHVQFSDWHRQIDSGRGRGVLGETKKISTEASGGTYRTSDDLRPPAILTYDMKGNLTRVTDVLTGRVQLAASDLAVDSDNDWTDGAVVDGHVYAGWTYDYLFKRFGRRGLDNNNLPIRSLIHPVSRDVPLSFIQQNSIFYINAFWSGSTRLMVYGVGLPPNITSGGQQWDYVSGAFDIVAHELTHGVTQFSSNLIGLGEPGALNEAFSDIIATGAEFFLATQRGRPGNYVIGDEVITPGGLRSLSDPRSYGDPDHYAQRYQGPADGAGVHINSGIISHAFYLAIEGGTNRTSGRAVQGVGAANRDQIERTFYRAFTQMLPANAGFVTARLATIQSARDLFSANSAVERAVTQAWDAVGIVPPASPSLQFYFSSPTTPAPAGACGPLAAPNFLFAVQVAETTGVPFDVTASQFRFYNQSGVLANSTPFPFAQLFSVCGPPSNRIPGGGVACSSVCVTFGGAAGGSIDVVLSGRDTNGVAGTFASPRLRLGQTTAGTAVPVFGAFAPARQ